MAEGGTEKSSIPGLTVYKIVSNCQEPLKVEMVDIEVESGRNMCLPHFAVVLTLVKHNVLQHLVLFQQTGDLPGSVYLTWITVTA
jgi:hypothetical protein